ncbi:ABC transporter ATP-binding protein [Bradyrhizobium mercantei]|uniref:ABC transporter ATP-binding protein n=1 Tax=Bradyrhizobium mercantei TaxID=1904807 RepID=UPI0009757AD4|nr:ABC transporter ATP-binding protein [Bradyrhizobium mercantei]
MQEPAISIENLGKFYRVYGSPLDQLLHISGFSASPLRKRALFREFWALREFDLRVEGGERLGVIGENGSGKSTLLKLIANKLVPSEGTINISGSVQALFEAGTGFHADLSGRENIRASLAYNNLPAASVAAHEADVLDFTELGAFIDQPIKTYSSGMLARLAFAVATCIRPKILIVDEILGAGDAYFAGKSTERMRQLTERDDMTVLFVSHDLGSVQRLCSRVIWVRNGRNFMSGQPHVVIKEYLKFIESKTEQRLRAREMRLSRTQLQAMESLEASAVPLLLRLRTTEKGPQRAYGIGGFELSAEGRPVARLELGAPMDNSVGSGSYIVDDPANNNWGRSVRSQYGLTRQYGNFGGRDGHAPFVLSVDAADWANGRSFALSIVHEAASDEAIYVDYWSTPANSYVTLGQLGADGAGLITTVLSLPGHLIEEGIEADNAPSVAVVEAPPPADEPAAAMETETATPVVTLTERPDGAGRDVLRITSVEFIDEQGISKRVLGLGRPLTVRIGYETKRSVDDPVFAVTFFGLDGVQMTHQNTRLLGLDMGTVSGRGSVDFRFDPFRLGAGEYLVSVAALKFLDITNWGDPPPAYDRHDRQYVISVTVDSRHFKNLGLVVQDCSVSHVAAAPVDLAGAVRVGTRNDG